MQSLMGSELKIGSYYRHGPIEGHFILYITGVVDDKIEFEVVRTPGEGHIFMADLYVNTHLMETVEVRGYGSPLWRAIEGEL